MDKQTELAIHLLAGTATLLKNGQASARQEPAKYYRPMTLEEVKALPVGKWVWGKHRTAEGDHVLPYRTGRLHTNRKHQYVAEMKLKYGLKQYVQYRYLNYTLILMVPLE